LKEDPQRPSASPPIVSAMFFPSPDTATTRPVWRTVQVFERQRMPDPPLPPRPPKVKTKPRKAQTPKVPMPQPGLPTPLSEEQKRWLSKNMKRTRESCCVACELRPVDHQLTHWTSLQDGARITRMRTKTMAMTMTVSRKMLEVMLEVVD
jgi:hypothetical protein